MTTYEVRLRRRFNEEVGSKEEAISKIQKEIGNGTTLSKSFDRVEAKKWDYVFEFDIYDLVMKIRKCFRGIK